MSTLIDLLNYGQSYWLDNLSRKKITGGELKNRVSTQGLRGVTSNPSIFNKAISGSSDYDDEIKALVSKGSTPFQIYDALTIKDVQDGCDILLPVYTESKGADGFVSLEVSPYLARDTEQTMAEARRLYAAVNRPNCLIKIPGTKEGVIAIEEMLYEGISINVTLLFSVERYVEVAKAYVKAIQRRVAENKPVDKVISVASFFLSRIDVSVDQLLSHRITVSPEDIAEHRAGALSGKAGIASARLAYQQFKQIFTGAEWQKLADKGAHVQRPLWASTSSKNPLSSDVKYVETLIGPDTVNTLPDETIAAFADHGQLKANTIEDGLDEAKGLFGELKRHDIDIAQVTQQLENEGIQKFIEPYNKLITSIADKRAKFLGDTAPVQKISFGSLKDDVAAVFSALDELQAGKRLFRRDAYLWKSEPEHIKSINNRLGWLILPDNIEQKVNELTEFSKQVQSEGYKYVVLLGMGGSSLCSEVARDTFGKAKGFLELLVLDDTDPDAIKHLESQIDLEKTLFIAASKSGNTAETLSFFKYFYNLLDAKAKGQAGKSFIAITDAGTPLVKIGEDYKFRKVFINPGDIGGRYSVLSDFGLVPMALMGVDVRALLNAAKQIESSSDPEVPVAANPAVSLGAVLGICQKHGRDKVTFFLSPSIKSFGLWVEQLIAESTGKEGRGLIPVQGEETGTPDVYSNDRVFVYMYLPSDNNEAEDKKVAALEAAGHSVVRISLPDKNALGGEYYRWEIATAIAGVVLNVNPFDEPNVAEGKKNTNDILNDWLQDGSFKKAEPALTAGNVLVYAGTQAAEAAQKSKTLSDLMNSFATLAKQHDYVAILPYLLLNDSRMATLQTIRIHLRNTLKVATTLLNGPRYLHSTGQLHKGGPNSGLYIILIGGNKEKLPIPGEKYDFATLHQAQALGDFRSLDNKQRRVIYIDLGSDIDKGLNELKAFAVKTGATKN
jgi:transaldolase/glucose-6-phosphate isomerase